MIYTHDHEPMHVHIFRGEGEVVINIATVEVREVRGLKAREVRVAQEIVAAHQEFLISQWQLIAPLP